MKKALKMLVVLLLCAGVNVSAKTLKEETTSLISSMDTLKTESKDKIATLNKWLISNEAYVVKVLDKDLTTGMAEAFKASDYKQVLNLLEKALDNNGFKDQSNSLKNIKLDEFIDKYLALKDDLTTFVNKNKDALNIKTGTSEGIECSLDFYDKIVESYDALKEEVSSLLAEIGKLFGKFLSKNINSGLELSNQELINKLENYENYTNTINDVIKRIYAIFDEYENVFTKIMSENAFITRFKNKMRDDVQKLIDNCKANYESTLDNFIKDRQTKLAKTVTSVVASNKTTKEKNQELYNKIAEVKAIKNKFNTNFDSIIANVDTSIISKELDSFKAKANNEFEDAIKYIEDHMIIDEYDIKLASDSITGIEIDRVRELVILDKVFEIDDFKSKIVLANNVGILGFEIKTTLNVGTNSKITVKEAEELKKEYVVILMGDVDGNGAITVTDVVKTAYAALGEDIFNEYETIAADIDENDHVTVTDVVKIAYRALEGN